MNGNPHLWHLIARKMAGEASAEERRELQVLRRENPELQSFMEVLHQLWLPAEKQSASIVELAYARHMLRLQLRVGERNDGD